MGTGVAVGYFFFPPDTEHILQENLKEQGCRGYKLSFLLLRLNNLERSARFLKEFASRLFPILSFLGYLLSDLF
jgi:hypothetical protein